MLGAAVPPPPHRNPKPVEQLRQRQAQCQNRCCIPPPYPCRHRLRPRATLSRRSSVALQTWYPLVREAKPQSRRRQGKPLQSCPHRRSSWRRLPLEPRSAPRRKTLKLNFPDHLSCPIADACRPRCRALAPAPPAAWALVPRPATAPLQRTAQPRARLRAAPGIVLVRARPPVTSQVRLLGRAAGRGLVTVGVPVKRAVSGTTVSRRDGAPRRSQR